jgi:hypothetical protein
MTTLQNRQPIEIRQSKSINLFYVSLGLLTIILINYKTYPEIKNDNNLFWLDLIVSSFFGLICLYFIVQSADKKPICIIDQDKITINKTGMTYELKNLKYFRHDQIGARYTTINYLHFYDQNKSHIFKIHTTNTNIDYVTVKNILRQKLTELK